MVIKQKLFIFTTKIIMQNLFNITQDILSIEEELEETGGELTPEIEEKMTIVEENSKETIEHYCNLIKYLNSDVDLIKAENKRLKELADRKQKIIESVKKRIIDFIDKFGNTKKSGVKYFAYNTGEVSIRKSESVEVDEHYLAEVKQGLNDTLTFYKRMGVEGMFDLNSDVIDTLNNNDTKAIDVKLTFTVPLEKLINESDDIHVLRSLLNLHDCDAEPTVSKSLIKTNQDDKFTIAKINHNKNLNIK